MTDQELLRLRSEALGRVAEQLTAVRAIHRPDAGLCACCQVPYPCPTAHAAGVREAV